MNPNILQNGGDYLGSNCKVLSCTRRIVLKSRITIDRTLKFLGAELGMMQIDGKSNFVFHKVQVKYLHLLAVPSGLYTDKMT